LGLVR